MVRELKGKKTRDRVYNRKWEFYESVSHTRPFQNWLRIFREKYATQIPTALKRGEDVVEATVFILDHPNSKLPRKYQGLEWSWDFCEARMDFLRNFGFSIDNFGSGMDHILAGKPPPLRRVRISSAKSKGSPNAVLIEIDPGATQEEVADFLSSKRKALKFIWARNLGEKKPKPRAPRKTKLTELSLKYYYIWKKEGRGKLIELYGEKVQVSTTYELIARIIKERHGLNDVHGEAVRQQVYRAKKEMRHSMPGTQ